MDKYSNVRIRKETHRYIDIMNRILQSDLETDGLTINDVFLHGIASVVKSNQRLATRPELQAVLREVEHA